MPRKKKSETSQTGKDAAFEKQPEVVETPFEDVLADRFSRYSKYIIQERALPDARDGLKPVQRRILWAMYEDGNTFNHPYRKSAKTVGNVIGNYHPHGDISVYDAIVRMSQDWKVRWPLIDMQGNNGSIDDDPAAAMRYTEARLSKIANYLMEDIDKQTVEWSPNFSDEKMEPTVLPARYPNLLVNGITGIAAGYATNIPPHNLSEVIDGTIYRLKKPNCSLDEMMEIIKGPDFPTGGIVMGKEGIRQAFESGKGKIFIRSKTEIVEKKTLKQIVVTEIPYEVVKSGLVKRIDDIHFDHKIDGILEVRDESDRTGLRIVVDLKKEANAEAIRDYLFKNTDLQISYNYNVVAIVSKAPEQLGLLEILDAFIAHRDEVVLRRSQFDYDRKARRAHVVEGLIRAISILDEIIVLIRQSANKADSKTRLMERFAFTAEQAEAIVTLQLYRLSNTDITELQAEASQLESDMAALKLLIENPKERHKKMIAELREMKKEFETPRRSVLVDELEEIVIDQKAMIADEQVVITVSRDGYIKRVSMRSYNSGRTSGFTGLKEGDRIVAYGEASTLDNLLVVTANGKMADLPVYQLQEAKWKDMGVHLSAYVRIDAGDKIAATWLHKDVPKNLHFVFLTKYGMIKRLVSDDLPNQKGVRPASVMNVAADDEIISAQLAANASDQLILGTWDGFGLRYNASEVPSASPKTKGVKAIRLADGDHAAFLSKDDEYSLVVEMDTGYMKRIRISDLPESRRTAKGIRLYKKIKSRDVHVVDAVPYEAGQNYEVLLDQIIDNRIRPLEIRELAKEYSHPYKDVIEKQKKIPQMIRPLTYLPEGNWKEEKPEMQLKLFEDGANVS